MGTYSAVVITALFISLVSLSQQADVNITVRFEENSLQLRYILFSEERFMEFYSCLSSTEGRCSAHLNITAYPNYNVTNVTTSSKVCHDSNRDICYKCSFKQNSSSFVCDSDVTNCHSLNETVNISNSSCRSPCIGFAWSIENEGIVSSLDNILVHECGTSCDCLSGDNTTTKQKTTSSRPGSSKDETEDDFMMEAIIGAVIAVVLIIIIIIVIIVLCRRKGSDIPDEENTSDDMGTNMQNTNNAELKNKLELNKTNTIPAFKTDNGTAMKNTTNGNSSLPTGTVLAKDANKNNLTKPMVNKNSAKSDNTKSLAPQNSAKSSDVKKNIETILVKQNETDQVIANGQPLVSLPSNQSGEKQEVVSSKEAVEDANSVIEINPDPEDDYYGIDENEHEIVAQSSVKKSPVADRINIRESDYDYPIVEIIELQDSGDKKGAVSANGSTGGDRTSISDDFGYSHVPSDGLEKNKTNVLTTKSIGIDHDYDDVSIKSGQVQMKNKTKNDDYDLCTDGDDGSDDGADGHDEEEGPKISGATSEDIYSRLHEDIVREKKNPYDFLLHPKEDPKTRKPAPDPTHHSDTTNQQASMPNTTPISSVSSSEKPATDPSHDENSTNQETSASMANTAHHDSSTKKETSHSEDNTKEEKTEDSINDKNNEEPSTSKLGIKHSVKGKDDYTLVVRNNEDSNPDSEVEKL